MNVKVNLIYRHRGSGRLSCSPRPEGHGAGRAPPRSDHGAVQGPGRPGAGGAAAPPAGRCLRGHAGCAAAGAPGLRAGRRGGRPASERVLKAARMLLLRSRAHRRRKAGCAGVCAPLHLCKFVVQDECKFLRERTDGRNGYRINFKKKKNTFAEISWIMFDNISGHCGAAKLTREINHHRW